MSIESKLEALTAAVQQLTQAITAARGGVAGPSSVPQPAVQVAAPVMPPVAAPAPVAMPAPPTFAAPAPVAAPAAPTGAPFTDTQGLIQYAMGVYQQLGAEKGAKIQGILQTMGHANINDIKPEQFGQFYAAVEQLKVS